MEAGERDDLAGTSQALALETKVGGAIGDVEGEEMEGEGEVDGHRVMDVENIVLGPLTLFDFVRLTLSRTRLS